MNELVKKLLKNSTIKETAILTESKVYGKKDMIPTPVPMVNVALSGRIDGGLSPGLTVLAGPSKHFKSAFSLLIGSAYQKQYPEGAILFYDSEFGTPESYFDSFETDKIRTVHTPITDIEKLKHDLMTQLNGLERGDKACIIIDSIGNLASRKEIDDALDGKVVADMTRAKAMKSLFRMITPHLTLKDIPMMVVNHTYKSLEMYSREVVSGGCVVEGTKILTANGLKSIENITIDDFVETLEGNKKVTHTWNPQTLEEGFKECYEIEFDDGHKCTVSHDHRFLTSDGWIEAKNLVENTRIINIGTNKKGTDICYTADIAI